MNGSQFPHLATTVKVLAFGEYPFCNVLQVHKLEHNRKTSFPDPSGRLVF